jgi:hypothetical protein
MWKQVKRTWITMDVASYVLLALAAIAVILATILESDGHLSRWVNCVAIILTVLGGLAWYQDRVNTRENAPADIADSPPEDHRTIVPSTPQPAKYADTPATSSDNQHYTEPAVPEPVAQAKPAVPEPDVRPPYEHPTPEHIANILAGTSGASRENIMNELIGESVTWDGRLSSKGGTGDSAWVLVDFGLDDRVTMSPTFVAHLERPEDRRLLLLTKGWPIRVNGTIDTLIGGTPQLRHITAEVLKKHQTNP